MRRAWLFGVAGLALLVVGVALLTHTTYAGEAATVYNGSYVPLTGVSMSEAYASTINLSFDHPPMRHDHLVFGSLTLAVAIAVLGVAARVWPHGREKSSPR